MSRALTFQYHAFDLEDRTWYYRLLSHRCQLILDQAHQSDPHQFLERLSSCFQIPNQRNQARESGFDAQSHQFQYRDDGHDGGREGECLSRHFQ